MHIQCNMKTIFYTENATDIFISEHIEADTLYNK